MTDICLRAQFLDSDDHMYLTSKVWDEDLSNLTVEMNAQADDLMCLSILSSLYDVWRNPAIGSKNALLNNSGTYTSSFNSSFPTTVIGYLEDATSDTSHDPETLSLVTYTQEVLKEQAKNLIPLSYEGTPEQWASEVEEVPFEFLASHLSSNGVYPQGAYYSDPRVLRISKTSEAERMSLGSTAEVNFTDFFDIFKTKLGASKGGSFEAEPVTLSSAEVEYIDIKIPASVEFPGLILDGGGLSAEDAA